MNDRAVDEIAERILDECAARNFSLRDVGLLILILAKTLPNCPKIEFPSEPSDAVKELAAQIVGGLRKQKIRHKDLFRVILCLDSSRKICHVLESLEGEVEKK